MDLTYLLVVDNAAYGKGGRSYGEKARMARNFALEGSLALISHPKEGSMVGKSVEQLMFKIMRKLTVQRTQFGIGGSSLRYELGQWITLTTKRNDTLEVAGLGEKIEGLDAIDLISLL